MNSWDEWVELALQKLESHKLLRSLRPIHLFKDSNSLSHSNADDFEFFDELRQWDRDTVEVQISETTYHKWLQDIPSSGAGDEVGCNGVVDTEVGASAGTLKKIILFSGNDYLGLSSHPTIIKAATQAVQRHGMGPRGSALICGYTNYHRQLESSLAELKNKEIFTYFFDNRLKFRKGNLLKWKPNIKYPIDNCGHWSEMSWHLTLFS